MSFSSLYFRSEMMIVFKWLPEEVTCEYRGLLLQKDGTFQTVNQYGNYIGDPMSLEEAKTLKASIPRDRWFPIPDRDLLT